MEWIAENWELIAAFIVPIASLMSAFLPDGHWTMKLINALALNILKAKNDPAEQ